MGPELETVASRYSLEELIARGGMATVWRARDEVLARAVAVKILHPHLTEDPAFTERFRREAVAAGALGHPNIVAIYDTGADPTPNGDDPRHFIVMEWCGGGTLADIVESEAPLEPERAATIAGWICDALSFAHSNGVIHRDVKPANVLFTLDGALKVGDFGIAKAAWTGGDITTTGSILGTAAYMSPEQARGLEPDERSDVYALGVVLYELLTGRVPLSGENPLATALKHVNEPVPPPRSVRAGIPRSVDAVVMKALDKDPDGRFSSADDLRAALEEAAGGHSTTALSQPVARPAAAPAPSGTALPPAAEPALPAFRGWGLVIALVVLALAAIVVVPGLIDDEPGIGGLGPGGGGGGAEAIEIAGVTDFDPHGDDGSEHPEDAHLAADGDPSTAWATSTYQASFDAIGKPGVGLLFELAGTAAIDEVEVSTPTAGISFEVRVGDSEGSSESDFEVVGDVGSASGTERISAGGAEGRYVLVWIRSLPGGGGGRAAISEVRVVGG